MVWSEHSSDGAKESMYIGAIYHHLTFSEKGGEYPIFLSIFHNNNRATQIPQETSYPTHDDMLSIYIDT